MFDRSNSALLKVLLYCVFSEFIVNNIFRSACLSTPLLRSSVQRSNIPIQDQAVHSRLIQYRQTRHVHGALGATNRLKRWICADRLPKTAPERIHNFRFAGAMTFGIGGEDCPLGAHLVRTSTGRPSKSAFYARVMAVRARQRVTNHQLYLLNDYMIICRPQHGSNAWLSFPESVCSLSGFTLLHSTLDRSMGDFSR